MLEKYTTKVLAAIALAALIAVSFQLGSTKAAYSTSGIDRFGVEEVYATASNGNEWYVNMDDPRNDPNFRNLDHVHFSKNSDGSWRVSGGQIRMESWSPINEKWQNVEITEYAKIQSGSDKLLQLYSRGGHHTSKDECLGSAYKARLYGDGTAAWNKEVTHPAYAGNRGEVHATTEPLQGRWIGFKAVIYNVVEDGKTHVRLESYIDDDVTGSNGNLVVRNNWKLASVYEDKGGWATHDGDFKSSCGRDRDEILSKPGGTSTQNIAAFRSDSLTWSFKYLSVREIDPTFPLDRSTQERATQASASSDESAYSVGDVSGAIVAGQHVLVDNSATTTLHSVSLYLKKNYDTDGQVVISVEKNGQVLGSTSIDARTMNAMYQTYSVDFPGGTRVSGPFDVIVWHQGNGSVTTDTDPDYMPGNYFTGETEEPSIDLGLHID